MSIENDSRAATDRAACVVARSLSESWPDEFERAVAVVARDAGALREVCTNVAWQARVALRPMPDPPLGSLKTATIYYLAQRLRFDFNFERLRLFLRRQDVRIEQDALLAALSCFAEFGLRNYDVARRLVASVRASPDVDLKSRHVLLHGLWFSTEEVDMELLLDLSDEMLSVHGEDANTRFRRASALRRLQRFREALVEIDDAIDLFGAGDPMVHQDYVRERELIVASQVTTKIAADALRAVSEAKSAMDTRLNRAERLVGDSLFRTVEILGVFLALTTFVFGTASAAINSQSTTTLLVAMGVLVMGTALFLVMMRLIITSGRNKLDGD